MRRSRGSVEGSGPPPPLLFVKIKLTKFTKYNSQKNRDRTQSGNQNHPTPPNLGQNI